MGQCSTRSEGREIHPRFSWTSPLVRLNRRLPMPPVRVPAGITVTNRTPRARRSTGRPRPPLPARRRSAGWARPALAPRRRPPDREARTGRPDLPRIRPPGHHGGLGGLPLSPEHPFPAALDDAHAALTWLATPDGELAVHTERIAVGGASAGGGLAAALAQRAND